jgi:hypothetical protein
MLNVSRNCRLVFRNGYECLACEGVGADVPSLNIAGVTQVRQQEADIQDGIKRLYFNVEYL